MAIKKRSTRPEPTTHVTDTTYEDDVKGGRHPLLQGQHLTVYQFIHDNLYCTREDVSRATGIKSSTATARIKELIDEGFVIEPPGMRKTNKSGVRAKCLHVTDRAQGGKPLDRILIDVILTVDANGNYGAEAHVVKGLPQTGKTIPLKRTRITLTAPHPDSYRSMLDDAEVATVSRHELQTHADDIIDADFEVVDN